MAGERWIFTKEQLLNTPSRKSGIENDKELIYRQQAANLIQDMGQRLQVYPVWGKGAHCKHRDAKFQWTFFYRRHVFNKRMITLSINWIIFNKNKKKLKYQAMKKSLPFGLKLFSRPTIFWKWSHVFSTMWLLGTCVCL